MFAPPLQQFQLPGNLIQCLHYTNDTILNKVQRDYDQPPPQSLQLSWEHLHLLGPWQIFR